MDYRIVEMKEKNVVGISARTNNASPDMGEIIGGLWKKFYSEEGVNKITGRLNEYALGIYTDYSSDEKGDYTVIVACETDGKENIPQGFERKIIPAGKYAEFTVIGDQVTAVQKFWEELWSMDLPRAFNCDFEEYRSYNEGVCEIHIFIGLK